MSWVKIYHHKHLSHCKFIYMNTFFNKENRTIININQPVDRNCLNYLSILVNIYILVSKKNSRDVQRVRKKFSVGKLALYIHRAIRIKKKSISLMRDEYLFFYSRSEWGFRKCVIRIQLASLYETRVILIHIPYTIN